MYSCTFFSTTESDFHVSVASFMAPCIQHTIMICVIPIHTVSHWPPAWIFCVRIYYYYFCFRILTTQDGYSQAIHPTVALFSGSPLPQRGEPENEARTDKHRGEWNISLLHSILLLWHMMTADPPGFKFCGFTHSYSSHPFLCALDRVYTSKMLNHPGASLSEQ